MPTTAQAPAPSGPDKTALIAGIAVAGVCAICAALAWSYGIGTPRRMGAGFFPFFLGLVGIMLGIAMIVGAIVAPQREGEEVPLRRLSFITAAFILFGVAIEPLGLIITVAGTALLGSFADPDARLGQSALLAIGLALGIWGIFVGLLGLGIPVWPGDR